MMDRQRYIDQIERDYRSLVDIRMDLYAEIHPPLIVADIRRRLHEEIDVVAEELLDLPMAMVRGAARNVRAATEDANTGDWYVSELWHAVDSLSQPCQCEVCQPKGWVN